MGPKTEVGQIDRHRRKWRGGGRPRGRETDRQREGQRETDRQQETETKRERERDSETELAMRE